MGFFDAINEWKSQRYEKKVAEMQSMGKCPDCRGRGVNYPLGVNEFMFTNILDCPGCNGSGLFTEWAAVNQRTDLI